MNFYARIFTSLSIGILCLTNALDRDRLNAQTENFQRGNIRQRIQIRRQQQSESYRQSSGAKSRLIRHQLTIDGINREYYLYVPRNVDRSLPLVIALHGGRGQPQQFAKTTGLNFEADKQNFMVVYPAGIDRHWNDDRDSQTLPKQEDVKFISAVIDDIQKIYNIDLQRIYATGISNGGFMTQRLACELSDRITAFASVASTMAAPLSSNCQPKSPRSIVMINSPDDRIIPWNGGTMTKGEGGTILSVPQTIDLWRTKSRCDRHPQISSPIISNAPNDGTQVKIARYGNCLGKNEISLVTIAGGGHTWPGGFNQPRIIVGTTSNQLDASSFIWSFFQQHHN